MRNLSWQAAADGRYWIDVAIGERPVRVMIDLGLIDPRHAVGFELDPEVYDQLKNAGLMGRFQYRFRRDANGRITGSETGQLSARLIDPRTKQAVGPLARLYVCRGATGVPSRVGVVFFHRLAGCRVDWALDSRTWSINCP